jgi:hypothetical protein
MTLADLDSARRVERLRLRAVPIDGEYNCRNDKSNQVPHENPMLYVPPGLRAITNGIFKDVTTVPYPLAPGEFPMAPPPLKGIVWVYLNPKHDDYDEQLNRWKAAARLISEHVRNTLDEDKQSPELRHLIAQYEEYCSDNEDFTITGVHHRNGKYRCTIAKYHGKKDEPTTCGNFLRGKTCVAQILANYYWAMSEVKKCKTRVQPIQSNEAHPQCRMPSSFLKQFTALTNDWCFSMSLIWSWMFTLRRRC